MPIIAPNTASAATSPSALRITEICSSIIGSISEGITPRANFPVPIEELVLVNLFLITLVADASIGSIIFFTKLAENGLSAVFERSSRSDKVLFKPKLLCKVFDCVV